MMRHYVKNIIGLFLIMTVVIPSQGIFAQWQRLDNLGGSYPLDIVACGDTIYVAADSGLFRSTDNGVNWSLTLIDSAHRSVTCVAKHEESLYAGTFTGVYVSKDFGETWQPFGLPQYSILSVFAANTIVLACIHGGGLFRTADDGVTWQPVDGNHYYSFISHNNKLFAGTFTGIQVSFDNGLNWSFCGGYPYQMALKVAKNNHFLFGASWHNMFRSGDGGVVWETCSQGLPLSALGLSSVITRDGLIFAGLQNNSVYYSLNHGSNWSDFSNGLPRDSISYIRLLALSGVKLFAGCYNSGVWWRNISNLTDLENNHTHDIQNFSLYQNYPNPFNSNTVISYQLSGNSWVTLKIFDVTGRELALLVNRKMHAGKHTAYWDASNYPSGVYYYKLNAPDFEATRKMLFIK